MPARSALQPFVWDANDAPLADGTNDYVYGPSGTPVEKVAMASSSPPYLDSDTQGVRYVIEGGGESAGDQGWSGSYNSYGNITSASGSDTSPSGFQDGYTDSIRLSRNRRRPA